MNRIHCLAGLSLAFLGLASCASETSTQSVAPPPGASIIEARSAAPIEASTATLGVRGMSCPKCANNIDKQLREVPGVDTVAIDMGTGAVRLTFAGAHPSPAMLASAIQRSGFTLAYIATP